MKSSYVLIIIIFVILVSATVIAKLASQIQLAPKRPPVAESIESDAPKTETTSEPEPMEPIDIGKAIADGLVTVTATTSTSLSVELIETDDPAAGPFAVPIGTAFGVDGAKTAAFVAYHDQRLSPTDGVMSVSVLPGRMETTPPNTNALSVVSSELNWPDLVRTKSFRLASDEVKQYAVWALGQKIRLSDLQPLLKTETPDPRLTTKSISGEERESLTTVLTVSGLVDPTHVPLIDDVYDFQVEADAVTAIQAAYQAYDDGDAELLESAIIEVRLGISELKAGSPIPVELSGIELLLQLRSLSNPNLQTLPSVATQKIEELIQRLKSDNYPVADLELRFQSTLKDSLDRCLEKALLGQVRVLADRVGSETIDSDLMTRLSSAENDFSVIFERQFKLLEDKEILPVSAVDQARLMFVPNEEALRKFDRLSAVPLDDIPKSKRRDVVRQMSVLYLELAEASVKSQLPQLAELFAYRAIAQEIKAPGVNSKAQRILRTLKSVVPK